MRSMQASVAYVCGTSPLFDFTDKEAACYLAALIDGEGCVYYTKSSRSYKRCIQIYNTDWDIIEAAIQCLDQLGIHFTLRDTPHEEPRASSWTVMISGRSNLFRCARLIPMRATRKRQSLYIALANYSDRAASSYRRVSDEQRQAQVERGREVAARRAGKRAAVALDALVNPQADEREASA